MKKTKEITVSLVQQVNGLYKQVSYFDLGDDLPIFLDAKVIVEITEKEVKVTESQLDNLWKEACQTRGCVNDIKKYIKSELFK